MEQILASPLNMQVTSGNLLNLMSLFLFEILYKHVPLEPSKILCLKILILYFSDTKSTCNQKFVQYDKPKKLLNCCAPSCWMQTHIRMVKAKKVDNTKCC